MQKTLITLAIVASLSALSGCGSSDSGDGGGVTTSSYSGTVNKGIVSKGKVEICEVFSATGCTDASGSSYYVETETTEAGSYDVTDAPMGSPLLVLVSKKDANTTMMCDLESCVSESGTVSFGESFVVDDDWSLQAIIPATNSGTNTVNVTSLTDMAADEAIEVAGNGKVTEAIATNANNAVKAAFGLTKSITEIGALDLTDEDAVAAALLGDSEEFMAASYSASSYNLDKSELISFDSSTGGYTIASDAINNIMTNASALLTIVETKTNEKLKEANPDAEDVSLTSTQSKITAAIDDTPTSVDAIEASEELVAAKEFITHIRTTYNSVQDDGDLRTGLDDFSDEFNGIDDLVSVDLDSISENLSFAVSAIAEAVDNDGEEDSFEASNGYTVTIENNTYSVNEESGDVVVEAVVTGTDTITDDVTKVPCENEDYICGETWESSAGNVALTLTSVEIKQGSTSLSATGSATASGFNAKGGWSDTSDGDWSEVENETMSLDKANIALDVELTYASDASEASFVGKITLDLKDLAFTEQGSYQESNTEAGYNGSDTEETTLDAGEMSILFDGKVTANNEESGNGTLGVYLSLMADNSLGYFHNESWSSTWEYMWNSGANSYSDESLSSEETSTSYVKLHAIARVTTNIVDAENNGMPASIELKADRNAYDVVDTSITIDYDDIDVILEADIGLYGTVNSDLTVRNTTGAVATINALDDDADKFEGVLTVNNVETASIEETDAGLVLIRYTDGTFESLF